MSKYKMPDFSGLGDSIIKFATEYWGYWWVLLLGVIAFGVYIIFS